MLLLVEPWRCDKELRLLNVWNFENFSRPAYRRGIHFSWIPEVYEGSAHRAFLLPVCLFQVCIAIHECSTASPRGGPAVFALMSGSASLPSLLPLYPPFEQRRPDVAQPILAGIPKESKNW